MTMTAVVTDRIKQAVDNYRSKREQVTRQTKKVNELLRRKRELAERLETLTDEQARAKQARIDAGIKFATGGFTESDLAKARKRCEEADLAVAELRELVDSIEQGIVEVDRSLPGLSEGTAQAERSIWHVAFEEHKEAIPAQAIRWLERGLALERQIRGSGLHFVMPEFDLERLTIVEDELRRELGITTC